MLVNEEKFQNIVNSFAKSAKLISWQVMKGGSSTDVFLLKIQQKNEILKYVLRTEGPKPAENNTKVEFALLNSLYLQNIPVSKPVYLDISCKIIDKPFMIMTYLDGDIDSPDNKDLNSISKMVEALKIIHGIDISALPQLSLRIDPLSNIETLLPSGAEWDDLKTFLLSLSDQRYKGKSVLLHGDFWSGNILWENNEIAGILDWEYAAFGDPLCDVAASCLEVRYEFGKELMTTFKDTYSNFLPIDNFRYSLWLIYIAASTLYHIHQWNISKEKEALIKKETVNVINEEFESLLHQSKE
jgi:aminoglycoside phosphotransferase (APT) family kinase protein